MVIHCSNFRAVFHLLWAHSSAQLWLRLIVQVGCSLQPICDMKKPREISKCEYPLIENIHFEKNLTVYSNSGAPLLQCVLFWEDLGCGYYPKNLSEACVYRCSFFKMNVFYKRVFTFWNFARFLSSQFSQRRVMSSVSPLEVKTTRKFEQWITT